MREIMTEWNTEQGHLDVIDVDTGRCVGWVTENRNSVLAVTHHTHDGGPEIIGRYGSQEAAIAKLQQFANDLYSGNAGTCA